MGGVLGASLFALEKLTGEEVSDAISEAPEIFEGKDGHCYDGDN
jgi:hypothetical protein